MEIDLHVVLDRNPLTREEFVAVAPPFAIALDGYVAGPPFYDPTGPRQSFNHHEGVDRLATRATCEQVLLAIRMGFFDRFSGLESPVLHVFVNDCDEDVSASVWALRNAWKLRSVVAPQINMVFGVNGLLDATAGMYPFPADMPSLRQQDWVMEPYRVARRSGLLDRRRPDEYRSVIDQVGERLDLCHAGKACEISAASGYRLARGPDGEELRPSARWAVVEEAASDPLWRRGYFGAGHTAYVAHRLRPDGRHVYALGRMSEWVPFPVPELLAALTDADDAPARAERWGGSTIVGGSPRTAGSALPPADVVWAIRAATRY